MSEDVYKKEIRRVRRRDRGKKVGAVWLAGALRRAFLDLVKGLEKKVIDQSIAIDVLSTPALETVECAGSGQSRGD